MVPSWSPQSSQVSGPCLWEFWMSVRSNLILQTLWFTTLQSVRWRRVTNGHLLSNSCRRWSLWTWLMKSAGTPPSVLVRHAVSGKWPFSCCLHFWRNAGKVGTAGQVGCLTVQEPRWLIAVASSPSMLPSVPVKKAWRQLTQRVLSVGQCQDKMQKFNAFVSDVISKIQLIYQITSSTAQGGGGSFRIGNLQERGWLLWITDGRGNPLIDRKVVGFVFVGVVAMVAVVTSPTTAGLSVV